MTFPAVAPSARSFEAGDFPVKKYQAQDGAELRILYGDRRTGMKLSLSYNNIPDTEAQLFVFHYASMQGTFQQFVINQGARTGWEGNEEAIGAEYWQQQWRYEGPPVLNSTYPGRSSVSVRLVAVSMTS